MKWSKAKGIFLMIPILIITAGIGIVGIITMPQPSADKISASQESVAVLEIFDGSKTQKYNVNVEKDDTVLSTMKKLESISGDFKFEIKESSFGAFVTSINGISPDITKEFWGFYVNGEMAQVGISDQKVNGDDLIRFQLDKIN